jgi:dipeptidyl-peptidase-4
MRKLALLPLALLLACPAERAKRPDDKPVPVALDGERLPLDRIFEDPPLAGATPRAMKLSPDGGRLTYLKASAEDAEVLDLWARDLKSGKSAALVTTKQLTGGGEIELSEAERMANERKRVRHQGITSYQYCGEAGDKLLFPLASQLYLVTLNERGHDVQKLTDDARPKLDPKCSKAGDLVVFVMESDLFVVDVETRAQRRLTTRGSETAHNGVAEFIAQEEMGRYSGFWIGPKGEWLAYLSVDESKVGVKKRPFIHADRTELYEQRYPAAGEENAEVKLNLLDLKTGKIVPQRLSSDGGYIPRVGWTESGRLWAQWQSRDQKKLQLLWGQPHKRKAVAFEQLLEETDDAWVEIHDDLRFLEKREAFLWRSERDGVSRVWLQPTGEGEARVLTPGDDPVTAIVGVDEESGQLWYTRATDRGKQRHLFRVSLDGGDEERLTEGRGWHSITWGKTALIDGYSELFVPPRVALLDKDGKETAVLEANPAEEWAKFARPRASFVDAEAPDGTQLNALLLEPQGLPSGARAPVIVYVYGGPTGQVVADRWSRQLAVLTHWTQRGFGVYLVDNRGMGGRDRAFTRAHYRKVGVVEVEDVFAAVRGLREVEWVDPARVGIFGWSYGGFLAARSILDGETPFAAAAAVAPVTDWTLYDTHYTERYLGTPQAEAEAYRRSNVVLRAGELGGRKLLLMHGMADDNVLFANTLKLSQALQEEGAVFELMAYPGKAHGLRGRGTQRHVFRTITDFFERTLVP